jgi:hypothetical protein
MRADPWVEAADGALDSAPPAGGSKETLHQACAPAKGASSAFLAAQEFAPRPQRRFTAARHAAHLDLREGIEQRAQAQRAGTALTGSQTDS